LSIRSQLWVRLRLGRSLWSSRAPASPSPADLRHDNQVVALGPTDGASYDIPNFPVLELARWLAARSKGAYVNRNVRGQCWIPTKPAAVTRTPRAGPGRKFSFKKSGIGADAIRAAESKRRLTAEGWSRTCADRWTARGGCGGRGWRRVQEMLGAQGWSRTCADQRTACDACGEREHNL
jgi:hypothetical protein